MTDREAMKMALHALEFSSPAIEDFGSTEQLTDCHRAIMALYKSLAQPEQEPVCDKDPFYCWSIRCQVGKVCKHTAQPEQDERLRKDANRYRWLKKYISQLFMMTEKQMNEQVDRAMSGGVLNKTPCECIDQFWCATFDRCKKNDAI